MNQGSRHHSILANTTINYFFYNGIQAAYPPKVVTPAVAPAFVPEDVPVDVEPVVVAKQASPAKVRTPAKLVAADPDVAVKDQAAERVAPAPVAKAAAPARLVATTRLAKVVAPAPLAKVVAAAPVAKVAAPFVAPAPFAKIVDPLTYPAPVAYAQSAAYSAAFPAPYNSIVTPFGYSAVYNNLF
ncbi:hypothetical protein CBL_04774 [Carabus blaptoides fortunei]